MEEKKFVKFKEEELGIKEYVKRALGKGRISDVLIEYTPVGEKMHAVYPPPLRGYHNRGCPYPKPLQAFSDRRYTRPDLPLSSPYPDEMPAPPGSKMFHP